MLLGSLRHLMVYVKDVPESRRFYQQILGFLGYSLAHESDNYCMWNPSGSGCSFGIVKTEGDSDGAVYQRGRPA